MATPGVNFRIWILAVFFLMQYTLGNPPPSPPALQVTCRSVNSERKGHFLSTCTQFALKYGARTLLLTRQKRGVTEYSPSLRGSLKERVFYLAQQPNTGLGRLFCESHTHTDTHTRQNSSEQVIGPSQRPLPTQHTANTGDRHPCLQRVSNPRYQQWSGCRPTS
jgi:hypothetical protein